MNKQWVIILTRVIALAISLAGYYFFGFEIAVIALLTLIWLDI